MTYFNNVNTLEQLRKQYKELLKKHHPDNGGNVSDMQEINFEYDKLFKVLKDKHENNSADTNNTNFDKMKYDFEEDTKLREVLEKVIIYNDIVIEVIGNWIWISGNTYQYKEQLKEFGFKYAPKKQSWYFHTEAFRKKGRRALSMDEIRNYYGSTEVQTEQRKQLKQA
ncbi:MAG: J domain-containing protein [Lachnospiraceae bacterium]|nr:J domain-containing protein [Lachnospiraceae bacterium]